MRHKTAVSKLHTKAFMQQLLPINDICKPTQTRSEDKPISSALAQLVKEIMQTKNNFREEIETTLTCRRTCWRISTRKQWMIIFRRTTNEKQSMKSWCTLTLHRYCPYNLTLLLKTSPMNSASFFLCNLHFVSVKTLTCNTIPNTTKACEDSLSSGKCKGTAVVPMAWTVFLQCRFELLFIILHFLHLLQQCGQNSLSQRCKRSNCSVTIVSGLNYQYCLPGPTKWKRNHQ